MSVASDVCDCDNLPGKLSRICAGTARKANGNLFTLAERKAIISRRLQCDQDDLLLPNSSDAVAITKTDRPFSGIGDRLHSIIHRETGAAIPCSQCKREIDKLNRQSVAQVLSRRKELADSIVVRARNHAPKWWQRWGAALAPGFAASRVLAWINESCGVIGTTTLQAMPDSPRSLPGVVSPADDVTIVIKSFLRHLSLWRLVTSIRHYYPSVPIVVADDSFVDQSQWTDCLKAVADIPGVTLVRLPYDSGIARGRNAAVAAASTSRIVLCDDDFIFTSETKIENLLTVMDAGGYDIVGGVVRMNGARPENWTGRLSFTGSKPNRTVHLKPLANSPFLVAGLHCQESDITLNFFAARRDALLKVPWDTRYQITEEHLDSFLEWHQAGLRVSWTKDCGIGHWQTSPLDYKKKRNRRDGFSRLDKKWGVKRRDLVRRHAVEGLKEMTTRGEFEKVFTTEKPPIVILGTGRCGSSIASQMLLQLGWQCPLVDEYGEHPHLVEMNERIIRHDIFDDYRAQRLFGSLPPPWVLKDPRLAITLPRWMKLMNEHQPLLLWVTRDLVAVRKSMTKQRWGNLQPDGEVILRGHSIAELHSMCEQHFKDWPWKKLHVEYEQLKAAISLFDTARG